jgi:hypothetical protein
MFFPIVFLHYYITNLSQKKPLMVYHSNNGKEIDAKGALEQFIEKSL